MDRALTADGERAAAAGGATVETDRLTMAVLAGIIIGALVLNRFGFFYDGKPVPLGLPITLACVALLVVFGRIELNFGRLIFYMVTVATLALLVAAAPKAFSLNSFLMLLVLYACFVFQLAPNRIDYRDILRLFQNVALFIAVAGILQFAAQFVVPGPQLFTFRGIVPDEVLMTGANTVIPIRWDAAVYKSNGFFLLEPSGFSQLCALAIVIELLFFERKWRLIVYALGLLLSYSGTGLLLLGWALPVIFLMRRQFWLVGLGLVGVALLASFGEGLNVDVFAERIGEFGSHRSSGFARFIAPWLVLQEHLVGDAVAFFTGRGPGSYDNYTRGDFRLAVGFVPHDPTWAKLTFEYGFIGLVVFSTFVVFCLFAAAPSPLLAMALLFGYLSFGGMLLNASYHAMLLVLAILPVAEVATRRAAAPDGGALAGRQAAPQPRTPQPVPTMTYDAGTRPLLQPPGGRQRA